MSSARRRLRDDSSDDERPTRRSSQYFKEIQQQQRMSGKVLAEPAVATRPSSTVATAPTNVPAAVTASAVSKKLFSGLIAAAPAPFTITGSLFPEALHNYIKALKEDNVAGVYVNGTCSGECYSLTVAERKQLLDFYVREASGLAICAHVTCASVADTIALAQHAHSVHVTAIAVSVPSLRSHRTSLEDALDFVNEVAHAVPSIPLLVVQDACAAYTLEDLLTNAVSRGIVSNLRGFIATSPDLTDFAAAAGVKGPVSEVLYACHSNIAGAAFMGATAFVGAEFSYLAPLYSKLFTAAQKGDAASVQQLQALLAKFLGTVKRLLGSCPEKHAAAAKALASLRSASTLGAVRPPGARLTVHEATRLGDEFAEFIKVYTAQVKPAAPAAPKHIKAMDGYNGRLNGKILERIEEMERHIGIRNLKSFFPHLSDPSGGWRKQYPTESNCNPARHIDHTLLKAEGTRKEISQVCDDAIKNNFYAVCVNGSRVAQCVEELRGSGVKVAAVIGFPLGAGTPKAKAREARELIDIGAKEIDMVMNIGAMKDGNYRHVYEDIKAVVDASAPGIVKVIFETCLLSQTEIIDASVLCVAAGAQFVKTSTGFNKAGATPEVLDIMLAVVGNEAETKAAGGVRDFATAAAFISSGVSRIGTSSGVAIISGKPVGAGY